jgi:hypothetical protein
VPLPPVRPEPAGTVELASIPQPPVRPGFEPAPKRSAQPIHRTERAHKRADKKTKVAARSAAEAKAKSEVKSATDDPVVSFLKKLVTPEKKPHRRADEADADPPSQMQPLQ